MGRLSGKVAFITGAASGIGAACALRFAQEGAAIAGMDLNKAAGGDWDAAVKAAPAAHFETGDVREEGRIQEVVAAVAERLGRIDVLVNSAGVAGGGLVHLLEQKDWDFVLDVNLKGTYLVSKHVLPVMLAQASGSIVNIASVEGIEGFLGGSSYNASKGGVVLLTKNMAIDYARAGVRVNVICPGFIDTPMFRSVFSMEATKAMQEKIREAHQLGRFGQPVEIANAALFLASDEASFVTGVTLPVDGGYTAGHRFTGDASEPVAGAEPPAEPPAAQAAAPLSSASGFGQ
jgi:NAD(P)-dependent dehydrogenase (short-subunit alcohol dehydrogenase family)